MIIDSHYAGPAYRPFVMNDPANGIKADWYASSLSGVRCVIGEQGARMDSALKPYISKSLKQDNKGRIVLASLNSGATLTTGNRLIFDEKNGDICQRIVLNP